MHGDCLQMTTFFCLRVGTDFLKDVKTISCSFLVSNTINGFLHECKLQTARSNVLQMCNSRSYTWENRTPSTHTCTCTPSEIMSEEICCLIVHVTQSPGGTLYYLLLLSARFWNMLVCFWYERQLLLSPLYSQH